MATIRREIEVQASPRDVGATWDHFIQRVLSGKRRLVCDEFACVNAVDNGNVVFAPTDSGAARMVFQLDIPDENPALRQDERGGLDAEQPTLAEDVLLEKEADARGDKPRHVRLSAENDATLCRSHSPT